MNNENFEAQSAKQSREYYELAASKLYEALPDKLVKVERAKKYSKVAFVIDAVVDGRAIHHCGDNAYEVINTVIGLANGSIIAQVVEYMRPNAELNHLCSEYLNQ